MPSDQTTRIPHVPIRHPLLDKEGRLTRAWIIFFEKFGQNSAATGTATATRQKATFGLVKPLELEDDLTNHYIARGGGILRNWSAQCKTPPDGLRAILDIERSIDEGVTWFSIFEDGDSNKIVLPDGDGTRIDGTAFAADDTDTEDITEGRIDTGDLLRINCLQIGTTDPGSEIEVVLEWWED